MCSERGRHRGLEIGTVTNLQVGEIYKSHYTNMNESVGLKEAPAVSCMNGA